MKKITHNFLYASIISCLFIVYSCKKDVKTAQTPVLNLNNTSSKTKSFSSNITIVNPGFESNGATQTPTGWTTTADAGNSNASYTQKNGHSGTYCLSHWKATAYQVTTSQTISGLATGYYSVTAWVENGGGQNSCYLFASNYGGAQRMTSLPAISSAWVQVIIRGIHVTNGTITIGWSSDANAGNWCKMDDIALVNDGIAYNFLKGGDLSELSYIESMGGKFYTKGVQQDCYKILKDSGFNIVRLRLYNDPGNPNYSPSNLLPAGFQNPTDILAQAKRAVAAGMQIELTFHYSDYWTNGNSQNLPHDWASLSYADLQTAVYNFTLNFMNQMKAQGTTPQFVSLGNEIAGGILYPYGKTSNFTQLATLLNQGYNAVKAVSPSTQVIIHLDDAGNNSKYDSFFGSLKAAGGKFDIIGASYYPFWTNKTVATIMTWSNYESNEFGKPVLIMETGYDWSSTLPNGSAGQLTNNGPYDSVYGSSPDGQKNFLYECFNGLKSGTNGSNLGDLYWDPVMIAVPGVGWELGQPNVVSNSTVFDFNGNSLSSLKAFEYNN